MTNLVSWIALFSIGMLITNCYGGENPSQDVEATSITFHEDGSGTYFRSIKVNYFDSRDGSDVHKYLMSVISAIDESKKIVDVHIQGVSEFQMFKTTDFIQVRFSFSTVGALNATLEGLPPVFVGTRFELNHYDNNIVSIRRRWPGLRISQSLGIDSMYIKNRKERLSITTDRPIIFCTGTRINNTCHWDEDFDTILMSQGIVITTGDDKAAKVLSEQNALWIKDRPLIEKMCAGQSDQNAPEWSNEVSIRRTEIVKLLTESKRESYLKDVTQLANRLKVVGPHLLLWLCDEPDGLNRILLQDALNSWYRADPELPFWEAEHLIKLVEDGHSRRSDSNRHKEER